MTLTVQTRPKWHAQVREFAGRYRVAAIERPLKRLRERALKRWIDRAFTDFVAVDGDRETMLSSLFQKIKSLLPCLEEWRAHDSKGGALANALLNVALQIDDGRIRHKDQRLKSYVDVSLQ